MSYKRANRSEMTQLVRQMVGPTLAEVCQEHKLLKAQQMRFEMTLKRIEARQDAIVATLHEREARMASQLDAVLRRMAELENKQ